MIHVENLCTALRELADEGFLRRVWSERSGSSFTELVCQTFDDTGLSDAMAAGSVAVQLGERATALIRRLDASLSRVDHTRAPDGILGSEAMVIVRQLAGEALAEIEPFTRRPGFSR